MSRRCCPHDDNRRVNTCRTRGLELLYIGPNSGLDLRAHRVLLEFFARRPFALLLQRLAKVERRGLVRRFDDYIHVRALLAALVVHLRLALLNALDILGRVGRINRDGHLNTDRLAGRLLNKDRAFFVDALLIIYESSRSMVGKRQSPFR